MADIFISYSHDDRLKVIRLAQALEAQGWVTWWDRKSVPGTLWNETIAREMKEARCVVVAWSSSSMRSDFVKEEAGFALAHDKLLPVTLDQVAPPKQFGSIETLDMSRWLGSYEDPNFVLLTRGIQRLFGHNAARATSISKVNKNRSSLRIWGITIGGTFYGFASGVIAKPLTVTAGAALIAFLGLGGYVVISYVPTVTSHVPTLSSENSSPVAPHGHTAMVSSSAFSPDGKRVVTASDDKTARIWDAESGAPIAVLKGHHLGLSSALFSPDGKRVVTTSDDKTARIWDAESGAQIAVLEGHQLGLSSALFSPDGKRVVTASDDKTARIWDAESGAQIAVLEGHQLGLSSALFSPDGNWVVTASDDKTARIWDSETTKPLYTLKDTNGVFHAAFDPSGKTVMTASRDGTVRIWDAAKGNLFRTLDDEPLLNAVFSPSGRYVLTWSRDGKARIWDVDSGREIAVIRDDDMAALTDAQIASLPSALFSPDGKQVLTVSRDGKAGIWETLSGTMTAVLQNGEPLLSAQFNPDGKRVMTVSQNGRAIVWDVTARKQIAIFDFNARGGRRD